MGFKGGLKGPGLEGGGGPWEVAEDLLTGAGLVFVEDVLFGILTQTKKTKLHYNSGSSKVNAQAPGTWRPVFN